MTDGKRRWPFISLSLIMVAVGCGCCRCRRRCDTSLIAIRLLLLLFALPLLLGGRLVIVVILVVVVVRWMGVRALLERECAGAWTCLVRFSACNVQQYIHMWKDDNTPKICFHGENWLR